MKTKQMILLAIFWLTSFSVFADNQNTDWYINILEPSSTSVLQKTSFHTITWDASGVDYFYIYLYKDGTMLWQMSYGTNNDGEYEFYLNESYATGGGYQIKMEDKYNSSVFVWSDEFFVTEQYSHDYPCGAKYLEVGTNTSSWTTIENTNLDDSEVVNPNCGNYNSAGEFGDHWRYFTVPDNGNVKLECQYLDGNPDNWAFAVYEGPCDDLQFVACDDNSGDGLLPALTLTGLNPGEVYYLRIWENNCDEEGAVRVHALEYIEPYISVISPTASTVVNSGESMSVEWYAEGVSSQTLKITILAGGITEFTTCGNSGIYNISVPEITETDDNAIVAVSLYNDPTVFDISEPFTVSVIQEYSLQIDDFTISNELMQQGQAVTVSAIISNTGNLAFEGILAIKVYDKNGDLHSVLASNSSGLDPNGSVNLSWSNQAIQAEAGDYTITLEYFDIASKNIVIMDETAVQILDLTVNGSEITNTIIGQGNLMESLVESETQQNPPLLSILKIVETATNSVDYIFLDVVNTSNSGSGENAEFELDYAFTQSGNYELQYIGFYDWSGKGYKFFDAKNPLWYYSFGNTFFVSVGQPISITDITNYPEPVYQGITTFYGSNALRVQVNNYNPSESITVEAIFSFPGVDDVSLPMSHESSNVWVLEKGPMQRIGYYDITYKVTQTSSVAVDYKQLYSRGFYPFQVDDAQVNMPGQFWFQFVNEGLSVANAQVKFLTPSHFTVYKDMTYIGNNNYFLQNTSLISPGYYSYQYVVTTTDGTVITSPEYRVFAGFEDDCSVVDKPGMIPRTIWHPSCTYSNTQINATPTHIIIHHTVTPNGDDTYARVRSIWAEALTDAHYDIAYHYLIGSDGRIYEGIQGGPERKGAHFSVMNTSTIGIAMIGTFHQGYIGENYYNGTPPTPQALKSLDLLLEWLCAEYDIDPIGIENHYYDNGVNPDMPQIAPHSIANNYGGSTACPGNLFPDVVNTIAPEVFYCWYYNSSHAPIELAGDIILNPDYKKSFSKTITSDTISLWASINSMESDISARFRVVLYNSQDTIEIGTTDFWDIDSGAVYGFTISNIVELTDTSYYLKLEYNLEGNSNWNLVLSDQYQNDFQVSVEEILDLDKIVAENIGYKIFPNPSDGHFSILLDQSENLNIKIFNQAGQQIYYQTFKNTNTIQIDNLPKGVHILRLEFLDRVYSEKIIVR